MANYAILKEAVQNVIKTNGNQEITGENLQTVLLSIINSLGADYQFAGVATPSTPTGTTDENIFYITGNVTFENFGQTAVTIPVGSIGVFKYSGAWSNSVVKLFDGIDEQPIYGSTNLPQSGGTLDTILETASIKAGENAMLDSMFIKWRIIQSEWRNDYYSILYPTKAGMKYRITSKSDSYCQYCFLKSAEPVRGGTPDFATGYTDYIQVEAGISFEVTAPDDANILYIYAGNANGHRLPSSFVTINTEIEAASNLNYTKYGDIKMPADKDIQAFVNYSTWDDGYRSQMIPTEPNNYYIITSNSSQAARYCFLKTDTVVIGDTPDFATGYTSFKEIPVSQFAIVQAPADANYLNITIGGVNRNRTPKSVVLADPSVVAGLSKKILIIGDSWGRDIACELWSTAQDMGVSLMVSQAYQGGSTLYNQFKGMDDATRTYQHGSFMQYTQGTYQLWTYTSNAPVKNPPASIYKNGECGVFDGVAYGKDEFGNWAAFTLAEILTAEDWDIILIRLHCGDLQNIASLTTTDDTKGFFDINSFITRMEQELSPACLAKVKWGLAACWSYPVEAALYYTPVQSVLNGLDIADWSSLTNEQKEYYFSILYPNMQSTFPLVCNHVGDKLSYAINIGKALQIGRESNWLKDVAYHMNRSRTDMHLGNGIPKYISALAILYSIFDKGKNSLQLDYIPDLIDGTGDASDGGTESNPTTPTKSLCIGSNNAAWQTSCSMIYINE